MTMVEAIKQYNLVSTTFPNTREVFEPLDGELCEQFLAWLKVKLPKYGLDTVKTEVTSDVLRLMQIKGFKDETILRALLEYCKENKEFYDVFRESLQEYLTTKCLWAETNDTEVYSIYTYEGDTFDPDKIPIGFLGGLVAEQLESLGWSQVEPNLWVYCGEAENPTGELDSIKQLSYSEDYKEYINSLDFMLDGAYEEEPMEFDSIDDLDGTGIIDLGCDDGTGLIELDRIDF